VLLPVVVRVLGPAAKESIDHAAIHRMTDELQAVLNPLTRNRSPATKSKTLRRLLYGLHTLVRLHLGQEKEAFSLALEYTLSPEAMRELLP
jgi:hypothetical protein